MLYSFVVKKVKYIGKRGIIIEENQINKDNTKTLSKALLLGVLSTTTTLITAIIGRSTTQIVDLLRRLMETLSTLFSLILFKHNLKEVSEEKIAENNKRVNIIINVTLVISGILMVFIGIVKYKLGIGHKNVVPGFFVSLLGVILNFYFVTKYRKSLKERYESIIHSQFKLYTTKTIVDSCVMLTMGVMIIFPKWGYLSLLDAITSIIVAIVLCSQGIMNLKNWKNDGENKEKC